MSVNLERAERSEDLLLIDAIIEWKTQPHTPELVTRAWQAWWQVWGKRAGLGIVVPDFPGTQEELTEHEQLDDKPIYVPAELSTQENRHFLALIWPQMRSYSVKEGNPVTNKVDHSGWRYTEASVDSPYPKATEDQHRELFASLGREGLTLNEYIIASQTSRLLNGKYFDDEGVTWSRLLGSPGGGWVVQASFRSDGLLDVRWHLYWQEHSYSHLGGRSSEGVQRT